VDFGLKKPINKKRPERILIVKLSAIGDVVHALAVLDVLRQNFPSSRIDWVVEESAAGIIESHPALDRVIISRRKSWQREMTGERRFGPAFREIISCIKELRSVQYDCVLDLQGLFKSGLLTGLSKGNRKIGMGGAREGASLFLNEPLVPVNYQQHAIDRYLQLAAYMGCSWKSWENRIPLTEADQKRLDQRLADQRINKQLVAINPMAKWETKLWEPDFFYGFGGTDHD
jgi:heptosyltransferase-1